MTNTTMAAAVAAVTVGFVMASASARAQDAGLEVWQPPQQQQADPAKRVPRTQEPSASSQPGTRSGVDGLVAPAARKENRGGFFVGAQAGKGWVYEDVDQSAAMINAGYRWQAGPVTLVGVEVAHGRLNDAEHDGFDAPEVEYSSVGANARFNFGSGNPVYALVRTGYWRAEYSNFRDSTDGAYLGVGLGVDFNRHFNMSLTYTNHLYFSESYWNGTEINSADTVMLGAEVRF